MDRRNEPSTGGLAATGHGYFGDETVITLQPRIDFGGQPFPFPVSGFSLDWLTGQFVPAQRQRLEKATALIADGTKRIEAERKQGLDFKPDIGQRMPNGGVLKTGEDQRLERDLRA